MVNHEQSNKNYAILSPHEIPSAEPDTVQAWRRASNTVSMQVQETASYMQGFIQCGGPEAVTALKATIKRLQAELEESKGCGQVQRYRALQQDLKQRDAMCAALRGLVKAQCGMPDAAIEEQLDAKVLKHDCLYGASREHLLRENRSLRGALEGRLITTKTAAPAPLKSTAVVGANGTKDSRTPPEGVQHLVALLQAAARLDAAQREHGPPTMRNAFTQADDGASSLLSIMEEQTRTLAAQKAQLLQKVAEGASALSLCERKADAAESELADMRRQKTELMYHQGDMSKEIRNHLAAEAARAERAEVASSEATRAMQAAREAESAVRAEVAILRAVLADKNEQVQRLQAQQESMKGALLAAMDNLSQAQARQQEEAGGVAEEVRAANRATERQLASAMALLQNVCRAAAESTNQTVSLAAQQRDQTASLAAQQKEMVEKMGGEREVAQKAIAVLEAQLSTAHSAASQADRERQQIQRQMIASSLLGRNQDRRLEETLKALRHNAQKHPPATTTTTTRATTSGAQDSKLRAEHEPPITHHLPGQTAAHSTTTIPASTATSIAAGTNKQPLPKLRQFRPRSAAAATAAAGAAPAVPHHTITTTTATTSAQPHQPKGCGRDTHSHTMQGKSTGPSSMGRQSAPLALGGGGGFGGGADAVGAATGAVLERSAALRMALQVLASSPHSLPEPTAPNEFAHTVGASEPARPNTNATRRPDAAAHVTLLAAQDGNLPNQNSAQDQQQQGPRQAAGDI